MKICLMVALIIQWHNYRAIFNSSFLGILDYDYKKIKYRIISISITVVSLKDDIHASICYVTKLRLVDLEALLCASGTHSTVAAAAFTAFTGTVGAFVPRPFWSCSLPSTLLSLLPVRRATNLRPQSINSRKIEKKATEYLSAFFSFLSLNFVHKSNNNKKSSKLSATHQPTTTNAIITQRIRILL